MDPKRFYAYSCNGTKGITIDYHGDATQEDNIKRIELWNLGAQEECLSGGVRPRFTLYQLLLNSRNVFVNDLELCLMGGASYIFVE